MTENLFKRKVAGGHKPLQGWMWYPSPLFAEIIARSGYDSVCLDLQHGAIDVGDIYPIVAVLAANGVTPMVRVTGNDQGLITRVLDAGVYGVICPDVRTGEEAAAFAAACRYPPVGTRGFGPVRPAIGKGAWYTEGNESFQTTAENDAVMVIVQIESVQGLENAEAILETTGVDGVYPGPVDFSLSAYGEAIMDLRDPRLREPMQRIIDVAHAAGKFVCVPAFSADDVPLLLDMGVDWLHFGTDLYWITAAATQTVDAVKRAINDSGRTGTATS